MARAERDFYRTPASAVVPFLNRWRPKRGRAVKLSRPLIVEPAAGAGDLLEPIRERWPNAIIRAFDIAPGHDDVERVDFLTSYPREIFGAVDLIVGNPPYNHAAEFLRAGLAWVKPGGYVAYLLPLAFLASQGRRELFADNMPIAGYVLTKRPSFRASTLNGKSNPQNDLAWYVWRKGRRANYTLIERLDT